MVAWATPKLGVLILESFRTAVRRKSVQHSWKVPVVGQLVHTPACAYVGKK